MTKLRISAKQINMFGARLLKEGRLGGCPRSWAAYYLDMFRPEYMDPALIFGIKFHDVCRSLTLTGRMPEPRWLQPQVFLSLEDAAPESVFGKMGRAALIHLPEHLIDVPYSARPIPWLAEQEWLFDWTTDKGVECEIDLRPDLCSDVPDALLELVDFKSTSDKRYALLSLQDDPQANLYAFGLMKRFGRTEIRASWIYVSKKTYAAWRVQCTFRLAEVEAWIHANLDATIELISVSRDNKLRALDLPGDETACQGRGFRCDYAGPCMDLWGPKEPRLISLEDVLRYKSGVA
jgi:hypothetical protein